MHSIKDRIIFARKLTGLNQSLFCDSKNPLSKLSVATLRLIESDKLPLSDKVCKKIINRLAELDVSATDQWILTGIGQHPRKLIVSDYLIDSHEATSDRFDLIINTAKLNEKDYVLDYAPSTVQAWRAGKRGGINKEYAIKLCDFLSKEEKVYFDASWLLFGVGCSPVLNKSTYLKLSKEIVNFSVEANSKL